MKSTILFTCLNQVVLSFDVLTIAHFDSFYHFTVFSSIFLGICSPFFPLSNLQNKIKIYCILCVNASHLAGKMHIWIYQMHFPISVKYSSIVNIHIFQLRATMSLVVAVFFYFGIHINVNRYQCFRILNEVKKKNRNEKRTWTRASGLRTRTS